MPRPRVGSIAPAFLLLTLATTSGVGNLALPDGERPPPPNAVRRDEWAKRREKAAGGDAQSRYEAAWWAIQHGLAPEAAPLIEAAHRSEPAHQPIARMATALARLAVPLPDERESRIPKDVLPTPFRVLQGRHVILLHQHDDAEARERLDLLERVTTTFYLAFTAQGFDLRPPRKRMVSAWFARQEDYRSFLRVEGAEAFLSTRGYYHPTRDLVVAYDSRTNASYLKSKQSLRTKRDEGVAGPKTASRAWADRRERELRRRLNRLEMETRAIEIATAAHEMVHQLIAVSGLAPTYKSFPIWLHEGLAAQFEIVRANEWGGIGDVNGLRMPAWRMIQPSPRLTPLLRDAGFDRGYDPARYAEAWSLVYFLRNEQPEEFLRFLDFLHAPPAGEAQNAADRSLKAFQSAFSEDLPKIEERWRRFTNGLNVAPDGEPSP